MDTILCSSNHIIILHQQCFISYIQATKFLFLCDYPTLLKIMGHALLNLGHGQLEMESYN
jgi:hypothetical protein